MVKNILIIGLIAFSINANSQKRPFVFDKVVEFNDSIMLDSVKIGQWSDITSTQNTFDTINITDEFTFKDSIVTNIYSGVIPDTNKVQSMINESDIFTLLDSININDVVYNDTLLFNTSNFVIYDDDSTVVFNKSWVRQYKLGGK